MNRIPTLLFVFLLAGLSSSAQTVTAEQALLKARKLLKGKDLMLSQQVNKGRDVGQATATADPFYVFNATDGEGFVIVSGDERTEAILGYSERGHIEADDMPDGLQAMLQGYADQIAFLQSQSRQAAGARRVAGNRIEPMIETHWHQAEPYNEGCVLTFDDPTQNFTSVTGCVPIGMAQLMYFHKHPAMTTEEIPAYEINYGSRGIATLEAIPAGTTIDWGDMMTEYDFADATDAQKRAVAGLVSYCAKSVRTLFYGNSASASLYNVPEALKRYFGYSRAIRYVVRNNYQGDWEQLIYDELAARRPVFMGGNMDTGGGHAFIIDGYDGDGHFHVNWGWQRVKGYWEPDGWFLLDALQPMGLEKGYNFDQDALVGVSPDDGTFTETVVATTVDFEILGSNEYTRQNLERGFYDYVNRECPTFKLSVRNTTANTYDMEVNIGLFKDGVLVGLLMSQTAVIDDFTNTKTYSFTQGASWFSGLTGTYQIYPVSRQKGTDEWLKNDGSDQYFVTAVITETSLKMSVGDASPTNDLVVETEDDIVGIYNLQGVNILKSTGKQTLPALLKSINILKYRSGKTKVTHQY